MSTPKQELDMGFTHESIPDANHICMIFDNEEQRKKIVFDYLAAGLRQGQAIRYIGNEMTPEVLRSQLLEMGVEIPEDAPINVSSVETFYYPSGQFDPPQMIRNLLGRLELAKNANSGGTRTCGDMSWVLKNVPGANRLFEYEALLNTVHGAVPFTGMCLYDARLFDGATLFKILQVHPYMVAQGHVVRNPYYTKPEELVR